MTGFTKRPVRRCELPKKVFIQFDDPTIGHSLKEFNGWVDISPISVIY